VGDRVRIKSDQMRTDQSDDFRSISPNNLEGNDRHLGYVVFPRWSQDFCENNKLHKINSTEAPRLRIIPPHYSIK
jgi:hypothetical protein